MKDHCLHCVLAQATAEWHKRNARASSDDLVEMAGKFFAELVGRQAQYSQMVITVAVMGLVEGESDPRKLN